ncbi:glycosyltransferase family 29 protein [Paracoccaceae bacterium]
MNRLGFLIARSLRQEEVLQRLSVPPSAALHLVEGQTVALVGNARSLAEGRHGAAIDAADVVIRINRAPMPSAASHGTRTDVLALATSIPRAELDRIQPRRIWWMSHKRKRLPWSVATSPGFHMPGLGLFNGLRASLGAPPTTGLMLIDWLSLSGAAQVSLYGFDFFASLSLSGSRTAAQVPHDFGGERSYVEALLAQDPRFRLIAAA